MKVSVAVINFRKGASENRGGLQRFLAQECGVVVKEKSEDGSTWVLSHDLADKERERIMRNFSTCVMNITEQDDEIQNQKPMAEVGA